MPSSYCGVSHVKITGEPEKNDSDGSHGCSGGTATKVACNGRHMWGPTRQALMFVIKQWVSELACSHQFVLTDQDTNSSEQRGIQPREVHQKQGRHEGGTPDCSILLVDPSSATQVHCA